MDVLSPNVLFAPNTHVRDTYYLMLSNRTNKTVVNPIFLATSAIPNMPQNRASLNKSCSTDASSSLCRFI